MADPSRPADCDVVVIGAGIVGVCIAYELRKRGADVVLIDREEPASECSRGNSGAISAGSVVPLATPGTIASLPGMLLNRERPLYLRWGYLPQAAPWLMRFVRAASRSRMLDSVSRLAELHADAVAKHRALAHEVGVPDLFVQRGHLHLYASERDYANDALAWQLRAQYGYAHERLGRSEILDLEPRIGPRYRVGAFLPDHATIVNPQRYARAIASSFAARGGQLRRAHVRALRPADGGWLVDTEGHALKCRNAVVAAGAWSRQLLDPLGVHVPLESQRGYHVQFHNSADVVSRTVVFTDYKVFVTPMEEGLRVGGTVEFAGLRSPPDWRRAEVLERIARANLDGLSSWAPSRWAGHRPCLPDSVPIVGPAEHHQGLWLAVGHGHLGLTDSVHSAERIANALIDGRSAQARSVREQPIAAEL